MKNNTVFCSVLGLIGAALVIRGSMLPAGPPIGADDQWNSNTSLSQRLQDALMKSNQK